MLKKDNNQDGNENVTPDPRISMNDRMILAFNYLTNKHRLNWLYGIRFIFLYSVCFFILYTGSLNGEHEIVWIGFNSDAIKQTIHSYIDFLNPLRLDSFGYALQRNEFIFLVGRYYQ